MAIIYRVYPEHVAALWPQLEALLRPALALVSTHQPEDVRLALMGSSAQLWCQMDGDTVEACVTTEFVTYPAGVFVRVWSAGAKPERKFDCDGFYTLLREWCERNMCAGFEAVGRHGWLRKVPEAKVEGLVMRVIF